MSHYLDDRLVQQAQAFLPALVLSLALHMLVLFVQIAQPRVETRRPIDGNDQNPRLDATLSKVPSPTKAVPTPARLPKESALGPGRRSLSTTESAKTWSRSEKGEMDHFLNELSAESKAVTGLELAQKALVMARSMRGTAETDDVADMLQKLREANVEPISLEMYFDALFRKMNRTAAMVKRSPNSKGNQIAAVIIAVNQDGSLKSFNILWAADQQEEIAYIKAVVAQAAPFPVFPADIRRATDTIILEVCILPNRYSGGSGAAFTRMAKGRSCRDPDS